MAARRSGGATSNGGGSAGATQSGNAGSSASTAGAGAGLPPPAKGLGTACATDADCTAPLACRFDTVDYTADMQCTEPCQSDDACTTAFGKNSLCIGANICVHACTTDADCSAKTHCNIDGWCERTGPGSGVPYCTGAATPCAGQSDSACILSSGCTDNAKCSGLAEDCFDQFDDFSCTGLGGCFWDSVSMSCSGEAQTCDEMFDQLSCSLQIGCTWSGGCTGIPDTCDHNFRRCAPTSRGACSKPTDAPLTVEKIADN